MLFSSDLIDKFIAWFIAIAFIVFVAFMLYFNGLTRALFGLLVFYYAFGAVVWHITKSSDQYTIIYEMLTWLGRWVWKGDC
jgi:hypothetical protein